MYHAHDAYLESRVTSAEPVELVRMMYQACMAEIREARRELAAGDIAKRVQHISKACEIVMELTASLDHERGGEISLKLLHMYDYVQRRLVEANLRKSDAMLAEVLDLLATLLEAWDGVKVQTQPERPERNNWAPPVQEAETVHSSNAWSF